MAAFQASHSQNINHLVRLVFIACCSLRASPSVLSMCSCRVKLDEGKVKLYWFGSGNWFWLSINVRVAVAGERHSNVVIRLKYDLTAFLVFLIGTS